MYGHYITNAPSLHALSAKGTRHRPFLSNRYTFQSRNKPVETQQGIDPLIP